MLATIVAGAALPAVASLRTQIVRMIPPTAALFDVAGLPVNLVGLEIVGASARIVADGDRRVLVVDGQVANSTSIPRSVPPMQVSIRNRDGLAVYAWATKTSSRSVAPGEQASFSARLASPPGDGADVVIEFGTSDEAPGSRKARSRF